MQNYYRQVKRFQWNIENILMITIKYLLIYQISTSNNSYRVDMPLKKSNQHLNYLVCSFFMS